ncbi:hypothetical protein PVAP13_6KG166830 [Panicum virgatum]|uniref:Uncharacterized protein n=1 Tax=Panicum virgatum TaxID=38727 RepID=A0A8T0RCT5_PANVG|nr:hypothetical protein PVAP13_6KG166830 [Panicum virgatum]
MACSFCLPLDMSVQKEGKVRDSLTRKQSSSMYHQQVLHTTYSLIRLTALVPVSLFTGKNCRSAILEGSAIQPDERNSAGNSGFPRRPPSMRVPRACARRDGKEREPDRERKLRRGSSSGRHREPPPPRSRTPAKELGKLGWGGLAVGEHIRWGGGTRHGLRARRLGRRRRGGGGQESGGLDAA